MTEIINNNELYPAKFLSNLVQIAAVIYEKIDWHEKLMDEKNISHSGELNLL